MGGSALLSTLSRRQSTRWALRFARSRRATPSGVVYLYSPIAIPLYARVDTLWNRPLMGSLGGRPFRRGTKQSSYCRRRPWVSRSRRWKITIQPLRDAGRELALVNPLRGDLLIVLVTGPLLAEALAVRPCLPVVRILLPKVVLPTPPNVTRVVPRRDLPPEQLALAFVDTFLTWILARNTGPHLLLRNRLTSLNDILTPPPRSYLTSPDPKPILP